MKMDGYEVQAGDAVFDITFGHGTVHRIDSQNGVFHVRYGQRAIAYLPNGQSDRSSRRTLYWQDPVFFVPAKDSTAWRYMTEAFKAMWDVIVKSPLPTRFTDEETSNG